MKTKLESFLFGVFVAGFFLAPVHAQTAPSAPASSSATAANAAPAGQAPDDATRKITELVHAGKYVEAQQLTTGLLVAYPDDQRLIKAKAMLEKLLAAPSSATPVPISNQPSSNSVAAQPPPASASADQLTGMDKLDYNALIELARQAQQTTDLDQQKASLRQFMSESNAFLRKHPDAMLLWQIRAASAIGLDDPDAGYEAGRTLLGAGAADSNDPKLQQLLSSLKIKGWLDQQKVKDYKQYGWILGTWSMSWSLGNKADQQGTGEKEVFEKSASGVIEGFYFAESGHKNKRPNMRGTLTASGEISWQQYLETSDVDSENPGGHSFVVDDAKGKQRYPSGWQPPTSYLLSDDKRKMTMIFSQQAPASKKASIRYGSEHPVTLVFEKLGNLQSQ